MSINRKNIIIALSFFKDPKAMKEKYGITITKEQIQAAERAIKSYQAMSDTELKHIDEKVARRWPYSLSETQKYDKLIHPATFTITQTILWQNIKTYLAKHKDEQKTDPNAIKQAIIEIEQFMQLNVYRGAFDDNQKLLDGDNINMLMKLFNSAYYKYKTT